MYPNHILDQQLSKAHRREIRHQVEQARGWVRYDRQPKSSRPKGNLLTMVLSLFLH